MSRKQLQKPATLQDVYNTIFNYKKLKNTLQSRIVSLQKEKEKFKSMLKIHVLDDTILEPLFTLN